MIARIAHMKVLPRKSLVLAIFACAVSSCIFPTCSLLPQAHANTIQASSLEIFYDAKTHEFASELNDLFSSVETLLPGDTITGHASIMTEEDTSQEIYLRAESDPFAPTETQRLIGQLEFRIINSEGKEIFCGNPLNMAAQGIFIGTTNAQKTAEFDFALFAPSSLGNEYAQLAGSIDLIFSIKPASSASSSHETPSGQGILNSTNDTAGTMAFIFALTAMACTFVALAYLYRAYRIRKTHLATKKAD